MSEFLFEIFSEEIPARFQKRAMEDLQKLLCDGLTKAGLEGFEAKSWVAVRRLGVVIYGLEPQTNEVREERKGPKVGAPQPALDGFIRAAGISSLAEARIQSDPKKGDFYVVDIVKAGAKTTEILAELLPNIIQNFPWPKSMRWGTGNLRWVRPIHSIIALYDGEIIDFELEGIKSGNQTQGHRFHGNGVFAVSNHADYCQKLSAANVVLEREDRIAEIMKQAKEICDANGLEMVEDIGLLEEVCGLVDMPVVILGQMDESFLDLPPEVIRLTLRLNQKYFVANSKATGKLAPNFLVVSNVKATDGGKAIAHGNARVLAARLNDARYFWDLDVKQSLESRVAKLDTIVFHQKIGSIGEKVKRIVELASEIAPIVGADVEMAKRAALLCKADLVTEMVGEFPELQGVMGRYYAFGDANPPPFTGEGDHAKRGGRGEAPEVANAIMEHYKPVGPSDYVPTNPVSIAVALADKFDTLVSFFAIGEKPTGSGDPYALRRAALGIIRIILETERRINLSDFINKSFALVRDYNEDVVLRNVPSELTLGQIREIQSTPIPTAKVTKQGEESKEEYFANAMKGISSYLKMGNELLPFFLDRLKVYLRDNGYSHDIIDAAFAINDDDILRITDRVKALSDFLKTEDGKNLLAGFKRATNILKAEEKKGDEFKSHVVAVQHFTEKAEFELKSAIDGASPQIDAFLADDDFESAMKTLAALQKPIYAFLDDVLVNDSDNLKRLNRLALLHNLGLEMSKVADFNKISG